MFDIIKLIESKNNEKVELETNKEGVCNLNVENAVEGTLIIHHKDYFKIEEFYAPNTFDIRSLQEISYGLVQKPKSKNEIQLLISTVFKKKYLKLHLISPG